MEAVTRNVLSETSLQAGIERLLAEYEQARLGDQFSGQHPLAQLSQAIAERINESSAVKHYTTMDAVRSVGLGNWAKVPWISILDSRETASTQEGIYPVLLFRQDMSGVYLALGQGVTKPKNDLGAAVGLQHVRSVADRIRATCADLADHGFALDGEVDMRADAGLGKDYEASIIAHTFYARGAVPSDDVILADLEALTFAYDSYIDSKAERGDKWAEAIELCRRFLSDRERFDATERDYKLEVAERVKRLFEAARAGRELSAAMREVLANPPNNLLSWRTADPLRKWFDADQEEARGALLALAGEGPALERLERFFDRLPDDVLAQPGARLSVAALLLMGLEPARLPMYRVEPYRTVERVLGWRRPDREASLAEQYESHRAFTEEFLARLRQHGLDARDVLDAQSLVWMLATSNNPGAAAWRGKAERIDELGRAVEDWRERSGYPAPGDERGLHERERFAPWLAPDAIGSLTRRQLTEILGERHYGDIGAGKAPANNFVNHTSDIEFRALIDAIRELLHGEPPLGDRIDAFLAEPFRGVKEAAATKLLSIWHHPDVLPIHTYRSARGRGKEVLMQAEILALAPPSATTAGEVAAASNELLRSRLEPYFGDDTWGMSRFLFDLAYQDEPAAREADTLDTLAGRLYVDRSFLEETIALLEEKRQLVFYGPPGTGKTYIARELARYLARDDQHRFEIVQFHPSYSYEDFVQGYRPREGGSAGLAYRLQPGPLIRLAEKARAQPDAQFVLLVDEINRGNLPRIFGELLFLLEYRDEAVRLMYAQDDDDRFSLPSNLLLIGTMNTADRSIGLIDAALRRRFHFKALFPARPPIDATLRRWLAHRAPDMAHVADLLDALNVRLRERFGEHLQVGPSYFMRRDLNEDRLAQIWQVDIMPFLEDQLFGREEELSDFTLEQIRRPPTSSTRAASGTEAPPLAADALPGDGTGTATGDGLGTATEHES